MLTKPFTSLCALACLLLSTGAAPCAEPGQTGDSAAFEINGVTITLKELEAKRPSAMFQAQTNYYEAARKAMDDYADEYLLAQEAGKEKVSVAALLDRHVNNAIAKDPPEDILRLYYELADTTETYESVRTQIIDALRERRIAKAKAAYMKSLRERANIAVLLPSPRAPIAVSPAAARGPAGAPVTLLEYADYECPYCQQMRPTLEKLEAEFKGKLAFLYKDFPLPTHANAQKAAEATRCAEAQGKYWEYHDRLAITKQLEPAALKSHARELKLDGARFDQCLDKGETAQIVKAQAAEAQALGLQGTPTFFVNGRYVSGNLTYERLREIIKEELTAAERRSSARSTSAAQRSNQR